MRCYLFLFIIRAAVLGALSFASISTKACADSIFVANFSSGALTKFDSSETSTAFGSTKVDGTMGLVCDSTGNLYVGMILGPIEKWDSSGNETILTDLDKHVGDLAVDSADNLYAINTGSSTLGVQEFSPAGALLRTVLPTQIAAPRGLAVDAAGNIYLGCFLATSNVIEKITPSGAITIFSSFPSPVDGLVFDPLGNLFVAAGNSIYEISPSGTRSVFVSSGLSIPQGLAFDSAGNLYTVSGHINTSIVKISPAGVTSTFATTASNQDIAIARSAVVAAGASDTPTLPVWALILLAGTLLFVAGRRRAMSPGN